MEIVLVEDVAGVGQKGAVVNVKPGYARNYLLPRKLAILATANATNLYKELQRQRAAQEDKRVAAARTVASRLAGDHTIFIAEVHDAKIHEGEPLLYFRGEYRSIARHR